MKLLKLLEEVEEKVIKRGERICLEEAERLITPGSQAAFELFRLAGEVKEDAAGGALTFYSGGARFPVISITKNSCALDCKHCGRHLLDGVYWADRNEEFVRLCRSFKRQGAVGCLITGGCRSDGSVPVDEFIPAVREIKEENDMLLLAHTGIIDNETARALSEAGLDGVSIDVVGIPEVARKIYGIEILEDAYLASLRALESQGIKIISPHVTAGLDFGKIGHELKALNLISQIRPTTVEITAIRPVRGTAMENIRVRPLDVAKIISVARLMFPKTPVILGCAHSIGNDRAIIEELAIKAGVSGIALPTSRTRRIAEKMGIEVREQATCCAIPYDERFEELE